MRRLVEGQKVFYEVEADRRTGKESTANLRLRKRSRRPEVEAAPKRAASFHSGAEVVSPAAGVGYSWTLPLNCASTVKRRTGSDALDPQLRSRPVSEQTLLL